MQLALWSLIILAILNAGLGASQGIVEWAGGVDTSCNANTPTPLCDTPLESSGDNDEVLPGVSTVVDNNPIAIVLTVLRGIGQLGGIIVKLCTLDYEIINPNSYDGQAASYMAFIGFILRFVGVVLSLAIPVGLIAPVLGRA